MNKKKDNTFIYEKETFNKVISKLTKLNKDKLKKYYIFDEFGLINGFKTDIFGDKPYFKTFDKYTINKDGSYRLISLPNPIAVFAIQHNTYLVENIYFNFLYFRHENINVLSKIYDQNMYLECVGNLYTGDIDFDISSNPEFQNCVTGYKRNKGTELELKTRYLFDEMLYVDISNFYSSIYTHIFDRISQEEEFKEYLEIITGTTCNIEKICKYVNLLDHLNMKMNNNETKGIITGPISSEICSEIILSFIDYKLSKLISNKYNDEIEYTRYVDDYKIYSKDKLKLKSFKNDLVKILRKYRLDINQKTKFRKNDFGKKLNYKLELDFFKNIDITYDEIVEANESQKTYDELIIVNQLYERLEEIFKIIIKINDQLELKKLLKEIFKIIENSEWENIFIYYSDISKIMKNFLINLLIDNGYCYKEIINLLSFIKNEVDFDEIDIENNKTYKIIETHFSGTVVIDYYNFKIKKIQVKNRANIEFKSNSYYIESKEKYFIEVFEDRIKKNKKII